MPGNAVMCPKASVYFVPGLGGSNPDDFKAPFRQLLETIFPLHFQPCHKEVLPNECKFALNPDPKLNSRIRNIIYKQALCEHVSLVWFAHSHGAKMICDAYKQLQSTPVFDKIKKTSAIICIGGASLATDDLARVVLNVEFKNDEIAKGGSNLIGERWGKILKIGPFESGSCLCCDGDSAHKPVYKNTNKSARGISLGISSALHGASTSVGASSAQDGVEDEKAHYIGEYLQCKKWRLRVQELLPLAARCHTHFIKSIHYVSDKGVLKVTK